MKSNDHSDLMIKLAETAGVTINTKADLIDFMKHASSDLIVQETSQNESYGVTFDTLWAPVIEGEISLCEIINEFFF